MCTHFSFLGTCTDLALTTAPSWLLYQQTVDPAFFALGLWHNNTPQRPQKVRCGWATVLQPHLPSHGLHRPFSSQHVPMTVCVCSLLPLPILRESGRALPRWVLRLWATRPTCGPPVILSPTPKRWVPPRQQGLCSRGGISGRHLPMVGGISGQPSWSLPMTMASCLVLGIEKPQWKVAVVRSLHRPKRGGCYVVFVLCAGASVLVLQSVQNDCEKFLILKMVKIVPPPKALRRQNWKIFRGNSPLQTYPIHLSNIIPYSKFNFYGYAVPVSPTK